MPADEADRDSGNVVEHQAGDAIQGKVSDLESESEWVCPANTSSDLESSPNMQQARQSYPCLFKLLDPHSPIPHGLINYASLGCSEDQNRRLATLKKFVKIENHVDLPIADIKEDSPLEDYSPHIRRLCEAVSKHCLCKRNKKSEDPIIANVHLGWPDKDYSIENSSSDESSGSNDSSPAPSVASLGSNSDPPIKFHILFLSHPHGRASPNISRWRDTRIAVPTPRT